MGGYAPVGIYDDEELWRNGTLGASGEPAYPPAIPAPANISPAEGNAPAVASPSPRAGSTEDLESRAAATPAAVGGAMQAAQTPRPTWNEYAPAQPQGFWPKLGHGLAALTPETNKYFNERPEAFAEQNYKNATAEYEAPLNEEVKQSQIERNRGIPQVAVQEKRNEGTVAAQETRNEGARDVANTKAKTAEEISRERTESSERVAKGHDLVRGEVARLHEQGANARAKDPNALTNTMKTMKQQAQSTLPGIDRALDETEKVAGKLGPAEGRWNEFWQGKVGTADPEFAHYKDEIAMVSSAVTLAHARGRMSNELFEHFNKMFDAGKQAPENMVQALNVAKEWLGEYATMGETPATGGAAQSQAGGGTGFAAWKAKQPK
jgi:hypothetical protein